MNTAKTYLERLDERVSSSLAHFAEAVALRARGHAQAGQRERLADLYREAAGHVEGLDAQPPFYSSRHGGRSHGA